MMAMTTRSSISVKAFLSFSFNTSDPSNAGIVVSTVMILMSYLRSRYHASPNPTLRKDNQTEMALETKFYLKVYDCW